MSAQTTQTTSFMTTTGYDRNGKETADLANAYRVVVEVRPGAIAPSGPRRERLAALVGLQPDASDLAILGGVTDLLQAEPAQAAPAPAKKRAPAAPKPATEQPKAGPPAPFDPAAPKRFGGFVQTGDAEPGEQPFSDVDIAAKAKTHASAMAGSDFKVADNIAGQLAKQGYRLESAPVPAGAAA